MLNVFELQTRLVNAAMPSGYERRCAELLAELAKPYVDDIYFTPTGSVVCHKKGRGKKLMFAAHMDVIGFMATFVNDGGFVSFTTIGGHYPASLINTTVTFVNGTKGIIKLRKQADMIDTPVSSITVKDLYIDIGACSKEEAEKMVSTGDLAMFDTVPAMTGDNCMITPYADDLAACCMLLMAMEQVGKSKNDLYFVFTVQEELGLKGALTAAFDIEPYMGIAIDLCYSGDDICSDMEMPVRLGAGPTIKIKDQSVICSPDAVMHLREAARLAEVAYQDEIITAGGTDTASIMHSGKGALAGCVSIPGRNIHSPCEIVSISDIEQGAKLIAACAEITL
ncbi:MAG: M20/M25/M40 family metallo-hydrolase [Clostridiaceae bacterium]|nr:M20/M25/M40 family metallo-hydrolase [Clostridiaceae bacterium]